MSDAPPAVQRSLAVAMVLQFAVGGAVLPFVSLYLRDQGLDLPQVSRVFTLAAATLLVFPFLWGMLADRFIPLNRLFAALNAGAALVLLWLARGGAFRELLIGYAVFHALFNPTMMLINALCFPHLARPAEQFGTLRAWGSFGWILPSLPIGLWLAGSARQNLEGVVVLGAFLALAAALHARRLPHTEPGARARAGLAPPALGYWRAARRLLGQLNFLALLVSFFLVAASFSVYAFYSSPRLEDLGMHRAWIGPVQSVGVVLEIALFRWRTRLIGRAGCLTPILVGCGALVVRQLVFAACDRFFWLAASYLLVGIVVVFYHIGVSLLVDRIATPEVRSTAQTLLVLCGSGLGPMFGNWGVGWLTAALGPDLRPAFLFGAGLALLAGLILWLRRRHFAEAHTGAAPAGAPPR